MRLIDYLKTLPGKCGLSEGLQKACGKVIEYVYLGEETGEEAFKQENFDSARDRARLGMPFKPVNEKEYEHALDILELLVCIHRQEVHGENYEQRINELKQLPVTKEEAELIAKPEGWWNA